MKNVIHVCPYNENSWGSSVLDPIQIYCMGEKKPNFLKTKVKRIHHTLNISLRFVSGSNGRKRKNRDDLLSSESNENRVSTL